MEAIINNWYIFVAAIAIIASIVAFVYKFFNLPTSAQLEKVKEWLLWAVTEAEKDLGGGTGALKLRQVYDLFVTRFPWLVKVISFSLFSTMVDEALDKMREMLKTNQAIRNFVEGDKK